MRHLPTLTAGLLLALLLAGPAAAEIPRVSWLEDPTWDEVMSRARADSGHAVLIHFHAPWCGPCRLLDVMVYNEDDVVTELADVVTVKVDIDEPANADMRDRFVVDLLPTLVWCDPAGREVNRFTGYRNATEFMAEVHRFRLQETSSRTLAERLAQTPDDPLLMLEMAGLQTRRGHSRAAEVLSLRTANLRDDPVARTRALLGLGLISHREGDAMEAIIRGREASGTGAAWTEVVAFQEAIGDSTGLLATYRARSVADDMDVVALDGFARVAVGLDVMMEEASRHALRAVVLSEKEPEIIATLAESYHRRGLNRKAVRWIGEAIDRDPPRVRDYEILLARYEQALADDPWGLKRHHRR